MINERNTIVLLEKGSHIRRRNSPGGVKFRLLGRKILRQRMLILMALPGVLLILLFNYVPIYGITIAFQHYNPVKGYLSSGINWVGLKYITQFFTNPYVFRLLRNTLLLGIYDLAVEFPLAIILALLLDQLRRQKFKKTVQTISYMPYFLSTVVVIGMLKVLFAYDGVVNGMVKALGGNAVVFLTSNAWFRTLYISSSLWQNVGWGSIIYLAALTNVDPQLIEASVIDGAGRFQRVWHISLPAILPTISIMLIFSISGIMGSDFTRVMLLYNQNTYEVADIIGTYVYREGIMGGKFEFTTAIGLMINLVGFILIMAANSASRRLTENSLW
jgi:putative aldouronate transport system permease protein